MAKLQFELYITLADKQEAFVLENKPIFMGTNATCQVKLGSDEPQIKAVIQKQDDVLLVKVFDNDYPIEINGKKYKTAKIKNSTFFKIGPVDVIASIEEISGESFLSDLYEESKANGELDEYVEEVRKPSSTRPDITLPSLDVGAIQNTQPESLPADPPEKFMVQSSVTHSHVAAEGEAQASLEADFFEFNIKFDEESFTPQSKSLYMDEDFDYSDYVDFKETPKNQLPQAEITEETNGHALHVIYMNNGVVIDESHFNPKYKRIFLSNEYSDKKTFQVADFDKYKNELIFIRDRKVFIVGQTGYILQKVDQDEEVFDCHQPTLQLVAGERVVLTKGTSQIIIKIAPSPPKIKHLEFFDFDEKLLKITSSVWAAVLVPLLLILLIAERPQEEKKRKEVVIIYKKKKTQSLKKEKDPTQSEEKVAKNDEPVQKKIEAKKEPVKKVEPKKVAQKTPVKKVEPKKAVAKKPVKKPVKKVAKSSPAPKNKVKPKKSYKFSSSSKMAAMLGRNNTKLKSANQNNNLDAASAMGSTTSLTRNFNANNFGKSNVQVETFKNGSRNGSGNIADTRGLSGKTRASTAYIEANTKILGAIDPELIRKIMREYIPQFRYCYQQELMKNPKVAGVFDLNFQINGVGKGVNVDIKKNGASFSAKAHNCLKRVVKMIKFPRPKGGGLVDVRQPMNFYKQ
ncbi:MAG: hypothetical protein CME62_03025 [Halobacteriovoraceae bacterium]|nr:hypothetical protein [Halobacteriovoraceae bacterium]|tara:strand:- start:583 stop:2637 length:2055 start_codon:yes stop_codon:yes gene_type:complete